MNLSSIIKAALYNMIFGVSSLIKSQRFWARVVLLALRQMNIGDGSDFRRSGELHVAKYVHDKFHGLDKVILFDGGANNGLYSKALADIFKHKARIYSFEPSKETFKILINTISGIDSIIPINYGLSDKEQTLKLYTNSKYSGLASVYERNSADLGFKMDVIEEVEMKTIDTYCVENNIKHIHFLKLDIEGHELKALDGAKRMIENDHIDFIQFEFGRYNIDSRTFFEDFFHLLSSKYKLYRVLKNGLDELVGYNELHEIFLTTNFLAERKNS